MECDSCHDYATAHVDGLARTFDDGDVFGLDPANYRQGYRLKMVDGQEPYLMPRPSNIGNSSDQFRICFQVGCHDSGPFTDSANMNTNLVTDGTNKHAYHLNFNNQGMAAADWSGDYNSRMTCVICHNVHGSTQLAMVRDGKLIGREPGQQIWYKNDAVTYIEPISTNPPIPEDLTLAASDGTAWIPASSGNLCAHCHPSNGFLGSEDRTPFQNIAQAPSLQWVGTSGLVSDGVAPDSAVGQSPFTFRVSYSDINNDSPSPMEVWVDLNDNGSYGAGEKFAMTGTDSLDTNLADGKTYTKSLTIANTGDGILNYRFYANDGGLEATGAPTADSTVTILNNAPILAWTGEDFYQTDGANPDIGGNGDTFTFRTDYTDTDNEAAGVIQVWIDENDNGSYGTTEKHDLSEVDSGDSTTSDGKRYATTLTLNRAGDGELSYRFYATDGQDPATGAPTEDSGLTISAGANSPPVLEFVAAACTVSGVQPQLGAAGADFVFTVNYVDYENEAPSTIEVWIDENDDGSYGTTEKYALAAYDGDSTYSDGKLYTTTRILNLAGDNVLNYRFYATDGVDAAVGEAVDDQSVTVVDALKVRPAGGSGWYSTIQSAIDAIDGAHTVLVYDGTYNEDVLFEFGSKDSNTMLRSVCGPDTTIINGSGSGTTVTFSRYSNSQIDGFQVTGGTTGITVNGTAVTINNCQVHDNNGPDGGGISVVQSGDMPTLTLTNSEIYNNSSDRGGGVRISRGIAGAGHIISNSIIRNNTVTGDSMADGGGGVNLNGVPDITIVNSVIKDNVITNAYAGGGLYVSQVPDPDFGVGDGLIISDSVISGNTTPSSGGGVYSDLSQISFVRSSLVGNTAGSMGGALARPSAGNTASFENCILADNQAYQAGMAKLNGGTLDIVNSTIANNQATDHSGVIYNQLATITIRNSILWGNQAATVGHIASFNGGSMTITDSIIQNGGDDGNFTNAPFFSGNVTPVVSGFASENDPWFVSSDDYHIQAYSPAVDNASATYAPSEDIDGQDRPQGDGDDIGADEYSSP
ncbi:MAG: choice-of-anchor Q domain-containing protein [Desulfuromonadaceae bacterium]